MFIGASWYAYYLKHILSSQWLVIKFPFCSFCSRAELINLIPRNQNIIHQVYQFITFFRWLYICSSRQTYCSWLVTKFVICYKTWDSLSTFLSTFLLNNRVKYVWWQQWNLKKKSFCWCRHKFPLSNIQMTLDFIFLINLDSFERCGKVFNQ